MPTIITQRDRDSSPQLGTDGSEHAIGHGYEGESVYGWDCLCGAGETDLASDSVAALGAAIHMATIEVIIDPMGWR